MAHVSFFRLALAAGAIGIASLAQADADDVYDEFGLYDDSMLVVVDADPSVAADFASADADAYWEFGAYEAAADPVLQAGAIPDDVTVAGISP